jgi:hypothetical protein
MINLSPMNQPPKIFRVSPKLCWQNTLSRQPQTTHYRIEELEGQPKIAGSATLQVFPSEPKLGKMAVPVLIHSHSYLESRGLEYAAFTSQILWFDAQTMGLMASCVYADNRGFLGLDSDTMTPWDWTMSQDLALSLPAPAITVDFNQQDVGFSSGWVPATRRQAVLAAGQGTGYDFGEAYSLSNETLEQRLEIRTGRGQGLVGYAWTSRVTRETPDTDEKVFWVKANQNIIENIDISVPVVVRSDEGVYSWQKTASRWTRLI